MNHFLPMSRTDAEALGFFRLPQRNTLFAHPRMPGFLFRLVNDLDEAVACGAMTAVGPEYAVSYFGLDLVSTIRAGKVGEFGKPKVFEARPAAGLLPSYEERTEGASSTRRYGSVAHVEQELEWTSFGTGGKYIGVISKADRGLIVDLGMRTGSSALAPTTSATLLMASNVLTRFGSAGDVKWKYGHATSSLPMRLPVVSGYIQRAVPVPKRAFLAHAKPGFIAEIEANDSIKRAYATAMDELIASASGETHDEFRIYPVVDDNNSVIRWSVRRRDMMALTCENGGLDSPFTAIYQDTDTPANGETSAIQPSEAMRNRVGVLNLLTSEKSRGGVPCPFWIVYHGWDNTGTRALGDGLEIGWRQDGLHILKDNAAFALDEINFAKVTMAPNSELSAGTVFGPISPRVRPGPSPSGALDASTRVEDEVRLRSADFRVQLPNASGTATEQERAAGSSEAALDVRDSEMEWYKPFLSEFANYIMSTVRELDKRARAKLKG